jgi:hypothetical protein
MLIYVKQFVHMWWKKWMERVKITFTQPKNAVDAMQAPQPEQFTPQERHEILNGVINQLFKLGECCCPSLMANNLFTMYLKQNGNKQWTLAEKINLRTTLIKQAKQMAYTSGPLIWMRPNIKKLNTNLGEFRNDDAPVAK